MPIDSARRVFTITLPAVLLAGLAGLLLVELWVRWQWDDTRGTPGFFLSDPVLGLRLSPGYDGWFAGAPVRINSLGFRDPREYSLEKSAGTFRILVLGDSVTFGHGALYETTYPWLLEQRLRSWRPEVDWQVWNLGVPGLNTSQELAHLLEVGERYRPDLVVVGFFVNDFEDNEPIGAPGAGRRLRSFVQRQMQRHLYSYELYKRVYLTALWRLRSDDDIQRRLEHALAEGALLEPAQGMSMASAQQLSEADYFDTDDVEAFVCIGVPIPESPAGDTLRTMAADPSSRLAPWMEAVRGFRALHHRGEYRIVWFVNNAPNICPGDDRFYDGGSVDFDAALVEILGAGGVPAVSSAPAFMHYRPSQMPGAGAHSIGNANRVKADVLFEYLRDEVLAPLLPL